MSQHAIDALLTLARDLDADHLGEATFSILHEDLYLQLIEAFDDWETALVHALKSLLAASSGRTSSTATTPPEEEGERIVDPDANRPFHITSGGWVLRCQAEYLPGSLGPAAPERLRTYPDALPPPTALYDCGDAHAIVAITPQGEAYGWDSRLIPEASRGKLARNLGLGSGVSTWSDLCDRNALRRAYRVITVTQQGQVKASDQTVFRHPVAAGGDTLMSVEADDALVSLLLQLDKRDTCLLFTSNGYAIRFPLKESRSMGLKTGGVRGVKLRGQHTVVASLVARAEGDDERHVAMLTERGYGKRCTIEDFRPQSRGGLGLVALKLNPDDALLSATPCTLSSDLAVITDRGRALRLPAHVFPLSSRQARGDRIIELTGDERILAMTPLLPAENALLTAPPPPPPQPEPPPATEA